MNEHQSGAKHVFYYLLSLVFVIFIGFAFILVWFFIELLKEAKMRRLNQTLLININILENAVNFFTELAYGLTDRNSYKLSYNCLKGNFWSELIENNQNNL